MGWKSLWMLSGPGALIGFIDDHILKTSTSVIHIFIQLVSNRQGDISRAVHVLTCEY